MKSAALLTLFLVSLSLGAPLPWPDKECPSVGLGIGVGIGTQPYKVKPGSKNPLHPCPSGWIKSLLEVDLCIEIGGPDHQKEQKQPPTKKKPSTGSKGKGKKKPKPQYSPKKGKEPIPIVPHPSEKRPSHHSSGDGNEPKCPAGQTLGTDSSGDLLDVCVDLGDLFGEGSGVKIGLLPNQHNDPAGGIRKYGSGPDKGKKKDKGNGAKKGPCDGPNDPNALLGLCVAVGGGDGGDWDPSGGVKIGKHPNDSSKKSKSGDSNLPPCEKNDPRAALKLCVKVGAGGGKDPLIDAGLQVGGGDGGNDDGGLFGGGPIVKIGKNPDDGKGNGGKTSKDSGKGKGSRKGVPLVDANASVGGPSLVHADASVAGAPLADVDVGGKNGIKVAVPGLLNLDLGGGGGSSNPTDSKSTKPKTKQSSPISTSGKVKGGGGAGANGGCPVGQILHLGVCVDAHVKIPGVVDAKADAKIGV
ncbi:hypothetical protein T439DRAFT_305556 [Meredithblackwellia eburnea MCA 4105]